MVIDDPRSTCPMEGLRFEDSCLRVWGGGWAGFRSPHRNDGMSEWTREEKARGENRLTEDRRPTSADDGAEHPGDFVDDSLTEHENLCVVDAELPDRLLGRRELALDSCALH